MSNLFENITNKILNQIQYLSTNIQDYLDLKTELNNC